MPFFSEILSDEELKCVFFFTEGATLSEFIGYFSKSGPWFLIVSNKEKTLDSLFTKKRLLATLSVCML